MVDHGESNGPALLIGDAELRHWSSRETEEYLANSLDEEKAGCYYLGKRTLIDLESNASRRTRTYIAPISFTS